MTSVLEGYAQRQAQRQASGTSSGSTTTSTSPTLGTPDGSLAYSQQLGERAAAMGLNNPFASSTSVNVQKPTGVDFSMPTKTVVPSTTLAGGQTVSSIMKRRADLERQYIQAMKPTSLETGLTDQLNNSKKLSRQAELAFMDETRKLQETGALTKEQSMPFLSETSRRFADESARLGIGMSGMADALNAEVSRRQSSMDGITKLMQFDNENFSLLQDLQKMTMPQMIGSPQVDSFTGEVRAFMQDPMTGQIQMQSLGNVGASKEYLQTGTYQDQNGDQIFWGLTPDGQIEAQPIGGYATVGAGGYTGGGSTSGGNTIPGGQPPVNQPKLTPTQLNNAAAMLGISPEEYRKMDPQLQIFFASPNGKQFIQDLGEMMSGEASYDGILGGIQSSPQPEVVKDKMIKLLDAYAANLPKEAPKEESWWDRLKSRFKE